MTRDELLKAYVGGQRDFSGANLRGADLWGANLQGADLQGADLTRADLREADLTRAILTGAYLQGAYLQGADLTGAYLQGAYLQGADLTGANLKDARLPEGVTFEEFRDQVLPALLAAGRPVPEEAWVCHKWENCPMKHCFDISDAEKAPAVWRPWVVRFVQLFDAGLVGKPGSAMVSP